MDEHRSLVCPLGEAGKVADVALSCRVQAVCLVLLVLIVGLGCSCLWRSRRRCWKGRAPSPRSHEDAFSAVHSGLSLSKSEVSDSPDGSRELPKMASGYSIKSMRSALSRWTRAKAKVRVVWKLNLLKVQSWLNCDPPSRTTPGQTQDLEGGDCGGGEVAHERGGEVDTEPPTSMAMATVGFGTWPEGAWEAACEACEACEALPAYADGDRVEYFSPTYGLWLLAEVMLQSEASKRKVSYSVTLKGRSVQERSHVPLELLRAPLQAGEPVELWSRSQEWLAAEIDGLEATTSLLRHYKVRIFGQEALAIAQASFIRRRFLKGSAVEVFRGPTRGWIPTTVSDKGTPGAFSAVPAPDAQEAGDDGGDEGGAAPEGGGPLQGGSSQGGPSQGGGHQDGFWRRGAPPRKADGSRLQPCDFIATVTIMKEFAVSEDETEEVPSFLLRPAASSGTCPSQVFQI